MDKENKDMARPEGPGSHEPSPKGLGPSGVDPSRIAHCTYCSKQFPSSPNLAFFENRAEGSRAAVETCKHCRCYPQAHVKNGLGVFPSVIGKPHLFEPHGAYEYDLFYCGCRGWD